MSPQLLRWAEEGGDSERLARACLLRAMSEVGLDGLLARVRQLQQINSPTAIANASMLRRKPPAGWRVIEGQRPA